MRSSWGLSEQDVGMTTKPTTTGTNTNPVTNIRSITGDNNNNHTTTTTPMLSSNNHSSTADVRAPRKTHRIPLQELINSNPNVTCNPGNSKKYLIESSIPPTSFEYNKDNNDTDDTFNTTTNTTIMTQQRKRKIPKIVHVTSKTRCMTPAVIRNIDQWRFPGYALYFHDDGAVDRLLAKYWPEFPQLQYVYICIFLWVKNGNG